MRDMPDVIGENFSAAELILKANGFEKLKVSLTSPPWEGEGKGDLLVVRQRRQDDDAVELVICAEDYQR